MNIVFVSNFLTHHQTATADYLDAQPNVTFRFIALQDMISERKELGWPEETSQSYLVEASRCDPDAIRQVVNECDILVAGRAPFELFQGRMVDGKPTFLYTDHLFKNPQTHADLLESKRFEREYVEPGKLANTYLLAASGFVAGEMHEHDAFIDRAFKWGYFPPLQIEPSIDDLMAMKPIEEPYEIVWVARTIESKRADLALEMARNLRDSGYRFVLRMLGTGPGDEMIRESIKRFDLGEYVDFVGAVKSENVPGYLNRANVLVFTSDYHEGWGAVTNEAMNAACTVVASDEIGSVPFLIEEGRNGLVFQSGSAGALTAQVARALDDRDLRTRIGRAAHATIINEWNPRIAAQRFLEVCHGIVDGEIPSFESGPMSLA